MGKRFEKMTPPFIFSFSFFVFCFLFSPSLLSPPPTPGSHYVMSGFELMIPLPWSSAWDYRLAKEMVHEQLMGVFLCTDNLLLYVI